MCDFFLFNLFSVCFLFVSIDWHQLFLFLFKGEIFTIYLLIIFVSLDWHHKFWELQWVEVAVNWNLKLSEKSRFDIVIYRFNQLFFISIFDCNMKNLVIHTI